jgi:acyl-coenzyme A thioesterase PaaI-like protein
MTHKVTRKQPNSKMCLVCGMKNPHGLKAFFYETETNELIALFTPSAEHQSYPGRLHGGITTAILDETVGRAIMMRHEETFWGVTVEFTTRFRRPVPTDQELKVIGRITKEDGRFFEGTGEIVLPSGEIAATGRGRYIKMPLEKIADFNVEEQEWRVIDSASDPKEIAVQTANNGAGRARPV